MDHRKRVIHTIVLAALSGLLSIPVSGFLNPSQFSVFAAQQYSMVKKQIEVNGTVVSAPYSFVSGGTTYMPLWYVIQALKKANVSNEWTGGQWNVTVQGPIQPGAAPGTGTVPVYVNGTLLYRANKIVTTDPSSHQLTTYIPIYTMMQVLRQAGIQNTWDGTHWGISAVPATTAVLTNTQPGEAASGPSSPGTTSPTTLTTSSATPSAPATPAGQTVADLLGTRIQNQAANDSNYWQRAGNDVYIYATSYNPANATQGTEPMLSMQPGQPIYLLVYSSKISVDSAQWSINSPEATISPVNTNYRWTLDGHTAMSYEFVAQKPGVYTIQAQTNGDYSVPLVLTVGLNQLTGTPIATTPYQSGIKPLPGNLPVVPWSTGAWPSTALPLNAASATLNSSAVDGVLYKQYQPIQGWIPVYGKVTTPGVKTMVVDFSNSTGAEEQNYTLPVNADGTFGGLLEVPFSGNINVAFLPNFLKDLTNQNMQAFYNDVYAVNNTSLTLTQQQQGLLASATMDYNLNSAMNQMASTLAENSPSMDTAMVAIANFVGDKVKYDWPDYQAGNSIWQDSNLVWSSNSGVCQDIAELAASMLKSIGVPTLTVIGTAPKNQTTDDHEWIQSWDGSHWLTIDPTWNSPSDPQTTVMDTLSSEYTTLTDSFQNSHTADQSKIGTWQ